ncbi:MAG TPA: radical SAM family heme chaperone HemW [Ignavibacteria bacterium]|nr:radical SAM family heme chaperone HemW [Ignavibacteria bacterium]
MAGIYLHIPFCDTKCIYCDFYSITNHSKKAEFLDAIKKEIISHSADLRDRAFDSIFFGGGTPSLLEAAEFRELFDVLYSNYNISADTEITIEANPGTLNRQKLDQFRSLPINRMSFGVQSFINDELKFLTRIHTAEEAKTSIKHAKAAGFDNLNLDLIFALPGQSLESWKYNLETAMELDTKHISAYSLIFEKGTMLYSMREKKQVSQADIDLEQEMYEFTMEFLENAGYKQYEISNYAKPGFECRHNLKYWTLEEYISFGPSASSYVGNQRWTNIKNIGRYIDLVESGKQAYDFIETIDKDTWVTEHIMLGLRSRGVYFDDFKAKHGIDFESAYLIPIQTLLTNGYAVKDESKLTLTRKGYAICDELVATLF